ncbi:hypothetical protein Tco_0304633 [Tanacetum coccineum]
METASQFLVMASEGSSNGIQRIRIQLHTKFDIKRAYSFTPKRPHNIIGGNILKGSTMTEHGMDKFKRIRGQLDNARGEEEAQACTTQITGIAKRWQTRVRTKNYDLTAKKIINLPDGLERNKKWQDCIVSIPVEDDSDIGSPGVDGPPIMPEDPYAYIMAAYQVPPSPDYIPGPEEPQSPPPLDFVPEPMYPEYMPQEDEILPAEEQPLPVAASPTADSPGYVLESDPEEEPEEDDEDPEEDPADYPADRKDGDDDDEDKDEDGEEEEEPPAPADSVPPVHHMTARISIRDEPSISLPPREEKRVRFASPTPSHEVRESSAAGAARQDKPTIARDDPYSIEREDLYGFVDVFDDDLVGAIDEIALTTVEEVNQRVTDLATIVEEETTSMYSIMEDAQDDWS